MWSDQHNISAGDRSRTMGGWVANSRLGGPILLQYGGRTSAHRLANSSRGWRMAGRGSPMTAFCHPRTITCGYSIGAWRTAISQLRFASLFRKGAFEVRPSRAGALGRRCRRPKASRRYIGPCRTARRVARAPRRPRRRTWRPRRRPIRRLCRRSMPTV